MPGDILAKFTEGIERFNNREFYECHKILEEVWYDARGPSRRFYQGLIHLAVGFYHITMKANVRGALNQLSKGFDKLSSFTPEFQGVELSVLLQKVKICIEQINENREKRINIIDPLLIPEIDFNKDIFISED
jgi:predicted metal-dependent hydrolase